MPSIGQKKPVHVYQLIAENTVESKVIEIQERKKLLIKEVRAFSNPNRRGEQLTKSLQGFFGDQKQRDPKAEERSSLAR